MVLKRMTSELYDSLSVFRNKEERKVIPSLSEEESNIGYAARIMSHYRLRALPVV
jgi:hypothetical protein